MIEDKPIRSTQRVPHAKIEPLMQQICATMNCTYNEALRLIGYSGSSAKAYWATHGAPAVAFHAARSVLADLRGSTMLTPPGTPAPELPLPPTPAPTNGLDHTPGLLTVEEPEPQPEPAPEPGTLMPLAFDECEALFVLLHYGERPPETVRRALLGKLAQAMAALA